jgi:hypothetical protein
MDGIVAGITAGKQLLAWQSYEVLDDVAQDDLVVLRRRWTGELSIDAGAWKQGTLLGAWSVGHRRSSAEGILISRLRIFPVGDIGRSSAIHTTRGYL